MNNYIQNKVNKVKQIDLIDFAISILNFEKLDNYTYKNYNHNFKIVIKNNLFYSIDEEEKGSIIDLVKYFNKDMNFNAILDYINNNIKNIEEIIDTSIKNTRISSNTNTKKIQNNINDFNDEILEELHIKNKEYLNKIRCIDLDIIKMLERKNLIFSIKNNNNNFYNLFFTHIENKEITGGEVRNHEFKGFQGNRSFFNLLFKDKKDIEAIILFESAIDAISYYQMKKNDNYMYKSVAGAITNKQIQLLKEENVKNIVVAFDNDEKGNSYYLKIKEELKEFNIIRLTSISKDWNQDLQDNIKFNKAINDLNNVKIKTTQIATSTTQDKETTLNKNNTNNNNFYRNR